jgi:hypothetical protein
MATQNELCGSILLHGFQTLNQIWFAVTLSGNSTCNAWLKFYLFVWLFIATWQFSAFQSGWLYHYWWHGYKFRPMPCTCCGRGPWFIQSHLKEVLHVLQWDLNPWHKGHQIFMPSLCLTSASHRQPVMLDWNSTSVKCLIEILPLSNVWNSTFDTWLKFHEILVSNA